MAVTTTQILLFVVLAVLAAIMTGPPILGLWGGKKNRDTYETKRPKTWLYSTVYGSHPISKIERAGGKGLLVYLAGYDKPIEGLRFESDHSGKKNCKEVNFEAGLVTGDRFLYHDDGMPMEGDDILSRRLHETLMEREALRRENRKLREFQMEYLRDYINLYKVMKEGTMIGVPSKKGGFPEEM